MTRDTIGSKDALKHVGILIGELHYHGCFFFNNGALPFAFRNSRSEFTRHPFNNPDDQIDVMVKDKLLRNLHDSDVAFQAAPHSDLDAGVLQAAAATFLHAVAAFCGTRSESELAIGDRRAILVEAMLPVVDEVISFAGEHAVKLIYKQDENLDMLFVPAPPPPPVPSLFVPAPPPPPVPSPSPSPAAASFPPGPASALPPSLHRPTPIDVSPYFQYPRAALLPRDPVGSSVPYCLANDFVKRARTDFVPLLIMVTASMTFYFQI